MESSDGIWGAFIPTDKSGLYRAEAVLEGTHSDGTSFVRSTQHLLPVVHDQVSFTGQAYASYKDTQHYDIILNVLVEKPKLYRAFTELWGVNSAGVEVPVCWLGGLVDVQMVAESYAISLELDVNWLKRAGAGAPLTLKNVLLQDAFVYVPLQTVEQIPVTTNGVFIPKLTAPMNIQITKQMREGVRPKMNTTASAGAPTLMLIHGYCANVNPWNAEKKDFTDASFFLEPSASLTNQQFTNLVLAHADKLGMTQWSGIGHSQGGIVLANILNYYHSGLDGIVSGRKIQCVGSPFYGCNGAGTAASLIDLFGYGCGENFDLTTDGSRLWLAGITAQTKKEIFYYTTTYKQGNLFGDACNLAVNLVLNWPNDGTCELDMAQLKGANNMGNKQKWCHTTDMNYPAQYVDHDRNKEMNAAAGR